MSIFPFNETILLGRAHTRGLMKDASFKEIILQFSLSKFGQIVTMHLFNKCPKFSLYRATKIHNTPTCT